MNPSAAFIDSHCHIAGSEFAGDLAAVVGRAVEAGVAAALAILAADDDTELAQADAVAARWPEVRFAIGVHPHAAGRFGAEPVAAARAVDAAMALQPRTRALGEIGLDYHYDFAPRDVQQHVFREQLALARRRRLPVVIHTRDATDDTVAILSEARASETGGVFHCFTGDRDMARRVLDLGFYISLAGIVTFPKATELHEVARMVPLDRLLVETDSPFLAPVPYRGSRNEPARVVAVVERIATLRGIRPADVARASTANFVHLFNP